MPAVLLHGQTNLKEFMRLTVRFILIIFDQIFGKVYTGLTATTIITNSSVVLAIID